MEARVEDAVRNETQNVGRDLSRHDVPRRDKSRPTESPATEAAGARFEERDAVIGSAPRTEQRYFLRSADPARLAAPLKVGLVWAGSRTHRRDRSRSIPLERLAPLMQVPGVVFFSLQKGALDTPPPGIKLVDFTADLSDFAETAALVSNLDLVISVDTSVAHLAGALAKPVWILLPFFPDWRWLLEREDSPWYPTARLLRQKAAGEWDEVIRRIAAMLYSRFLNRGNQLNGPYRT